jgi:hypothetical protein
MSNAVPTRIGQINAAGAVDAMFLKVFAGLVMTTFQTKNVALARHMVRTIESGKQAQFPAFGQGTAALHTPGTELNGTVVNQAERNIDIDGLLVADRFVANIDEAMNHYDVRAPLASEMGYALLRAFDRQVLQTLLLAARAAATVTGNPGGSSVTSATSKTSGDALFSAITSAAQKLDENDVPSEDRSCFLRPSQYQLLLSSSKVVNKDYVQAASNGGVDTGRIFQVNGVEIVKTNNCPITNINTGIAKYQVDGTNTSGQVSHKSAAGTVKLLDLAMEGEYQIQRQGTLLVAKYALGTGILRPEAAVEIKTA